MPNDRVSPSGAQGGADLEGIDFSRDKLEGAFLSGCNLRGIACWNSDFTGADFERTIGLQEMRQFNGATGLSAAQLSAVKRG